MASASAFIFLAVYRALAFLASSMAFIFMAILFYPEDYLPFKVYNTLRIKGFIETLPGHGISLNPVVAWRGMVAESRN